MASNSPSHSRVAGAMRREYPSDPTTRPFHPAALLNPRSNAAMNTPPPPPPMLPNDFSNPDSPMASLQFNFASPNGSFESLPQHPGNVQPNGAGHMIERMNNVEQRTYVSPQPKRRRLETAESQEPPMRFTNGGSSIIAHHLKENQQDGHPQSTKTKTETVDLTEGGGEEDVVMLQVPKEEEVCYGMIQDARLNCHLVPKPKPDSVTAMGPSFWPQVKIVLRRMAGDRTQVIHAYDCTRQIVGTVDPHTSAGLAPLLDSPQLHIRTTSRIASRRKEPGEEVSKPTSTAHRLDLVLYGPRKTSKMVGRYLSQRGVWLRKPFLFESGVKYENPQEIEGFRPPPPQPLRAPVQAAQPYYQTVRTVEEIRSEVMTVFDSLTQNEDLPEMEPDARIQTELLRHQKQGLYFMTKKEKPRELTLGGKTPDSFWQLERDNNGQGVYKNVITGVTQYDVPPETFGGILADMMGLGKTLSVLSLVVTSLDDAQTWSMQEPIQPQAPQPKKNGNHSQQMNVPGPPSLNLTRLRQNGKATLLICPLSTITNWEEQIRTHIAPGELSFYIYHGANRIKDPQVLANYDIVLTTYGSVTSEVTARSKGKPGSYPLEEIGWFRVVLDEAHMIREQSTLQFKAICRLQANRRWAVTGTPVQNKLDDLAALLAFLRLKPFDEKRQFVEYITVPFKVCDPQVVPKLRVLVDSVTLRRLKDKIDLPPRTDHIIKLEFAPNERKLYQMFEQNAKDKVSVLTADRERMVGGKTYIHILQSILRLRLISAHGKDLLNDADLKLVQGMTADSAIDLDSDDEDTKAALADARCYGAFSLMQETNSDLCIECQRRIGANDNPDEAFVREEDVIGYMTTCFHLLCTDCIRRWNNETRGTESGMCPFCSSFISLQCHEIRRSKLEVEHEGHRPEAAGKNRSKDGYTGYTGPHTKTRALVEDLLKSKAESEANPDEPPFKSVVFSAWTSHLDLIEIALDDAGITYVRLDGKMARPSRSAAMAAFREDLSVQVILVSISAGGLGLNLTSGNSVYVMEPQYNPAAEAQAVDRVHRLGQKRPVQTVRYIMSNSIEEKMLALQEKKIKLANLSMDKNRVMDKAEAAKQKLLDLRDLFR
ncbi:SNF2 family N-terminal domain-containing protein [Xylariaceae sp. FL0255]|nr:SNF2 family N-terminal domain-containing protein [Xylariaceae sp. FL0255]